MSRGAGGTRRCSCRLRRSRLPFLGRTIGRSVVTGLVWTGLAGVGGVGLTPETANAVRQWCGDLGSPPGPCCTRVLPANFRPDAGPAAARQIA